MSANSIQPPVISSIPSASLTDKIFESAWEKVKTVLKYGSLTHDGSRYHFSPMRKHKRIFELKANDSGWHHENLYPLVEHMEELILTHLKK